MLSFPLSRYGAQPRSSRVAGLYRAMDVRDDDDKFAEYVRAHGGARLIRKVLIANNGIAAVKAIRSIRCWSYETFGDERVVQFVAMATPEDVRANAEFIRMADVWVDVPGGSNNHNFANVHLIADIADRYKCHAVWAGWGHASEYPALPRALAAIGVVFLGPDPRSMHALGDKIASTIIAQSAGVPTVAWSGTGIACSYAQNKSIPQDLYRQACVTSADHAERVAEECGYPLVVKASEGGGGKGIRVVFDSAMISTAYRQVAAEVPGSPIFLMRLVSNARHLEVQLVADESGDAVALYGRDCSVQRRHQKIIEEGPVVAAPPHIWKRLEEAAIALAKEVGYVGAGTVEYLYTGDDKEGEFFFLELNPRLQVEHPVTEWITGVNLPSLQLHIGMGIRLENVPSIRRFFSLPENSSDPISLNVTGPSISLSNSLSSTKSRTNEDETLGVTISKADWHGAPRPPHGHVIACRITAENPDEGFQPTSGDIQELTFRNTPNVWGYFSVGASGGVHEFADSQFGHLFAWGETREASRRSMVLALKELSIRGDIRTTVEYIIKLMELNAFRENAISTAWLDSLIADQVTAEKPPTELAVVVAAVCKAHTIFTERAEGFTKCLERGQLPSLDSTLIEFPVELIYDDVKYSLRVTRADVSAFCVRLVSKGTVSPSRNDTVLIELRELADGAKLVLLDGRSHVCYIREEPNGLRLSIDGKTCLFPEEYDPTLIRSSVSGKLIRYLVESGDHVESGDPFAEMEVMKMYLAVSAPESGVITLEKPEGTGVEAGTIIAALALDDPSKVRHAENFEGKLPHFGPPQSVGSKPHQLFSEAKKNTALLLRGFDADPGAMEVFFELLDDPQVAAGEFQESLATLSGRIPPGTYAIIESAITSMLDKCLGANVPLSSKVGHAHQVISPVSNTLFDEDACRDARKGLAKIVSGTASEIVQVTKNIPAASELSAVAFRYVTGSVLAPTITGLLREYLKIERPFAKHASSAGDAIYELRDSHRNDLSALVEIAASHACLKKKNKIMLDFLQSLLRPCVAIVLGEENSQTAEFKTKLHQLSQLFTPAYADIALKARLMLAHFRRPRFNQRKRTVGHLLDSICISTADRRAVAMNNIVGLSESILDVLVTFVLPSEHGSVSVVTRKAAAEAQVLRSYRAYDVRNFVVEVNENDSKPLKASWSFRFNKRGFEANPKSDPNKLMNRGMTSFDSADNLSHAPGTSLDASENVPFRKGLLVAFGRWHEMEAHFDSILKDYPSSPEMNPIRDINVMTVLLRWSADISGQSRVSNADQSDRNKQVFLADDFRKDQLASEAFVSDALSLFCGRADRLALIRKASIKSVTFIVVPPAGEYTTYPGFYTFRARDDCKEDPIFRHIDPPMAFQLEPARLSNFNITRFGYPARTLHVFFAQDKAVWKRRAGTPPVQKKDMNTVETFKCPVSASSNITENGTRPSNINTKSTPIIDVSVVNKDKTMSNPEAVFTEKIAEVKRKALNEGNGRDTRSGVRPRLDKDVDARFFVRAVIRQADVITKMGSGHVVVSIPEAERTFVEALDAVEMASCDRRFRRTDFNHIFLNLIPPVQIDIEDVEKICRRMFQRYAARCWSLRVFVVEIKVSAMVTDVSPSTSVPLRFLLYNPTGFMLKVESYVETTDPQTGVERVMAFSQDNQGSLHGKPVSMPYPVMDRIQRKRVVAQAIKTTYVYDFLQMFTKQLQVRWRQYSEDRLLGGFWRHKIPLQLISTVELVLRFNEANGKSELIETSRPSGMNDVGIVVWKCSLFTPEYPSGREVIIIANDITFQSGSFGPEEDALFVAASRLARKEGIPRIYLAANSGARIGVATEVRNKIHAIWTDPKVPTKGIQGLAISEADISELKGSVYTGKQLHHGMVEVTDVLGTEHGLGVENLMGSGLIAGETSRAYDEIFTLTYVTARSVGIGAYLVRLGQRVIQKESAAPIILTGYSALNKVLGHNVYLSNEQLGGTKIMYPNGITHTVVPDDVSGVGAILDWLSYVPRKRGDPLPIVESRDSVSRPIECKLELGMVYDPRLKLIAGEQCAESGKFLGAFFDKHSWREYLQGWAKTVITGRARLGGVPTGVIAVETRSIERVTPADPASPETFESVVTQAGQVWYPDSAEKTAQAIKDFDREGLPLFIFANWRGFSGGMRDMFDEILKSGSNIVDALRAYRQPVFVYIPRGAELRGGAWVVLDTLINPGAIEMYADPTARGGVLEPEGTVDVKYRRRELVKTMHRLDETLKRLDLELSSAGVSGMLLSDERKRAIHDEIYAREAEILPVYRSLAVSFCDLHDTPGRLLAKGAIRKIVPWDEARKFFYWRLQRRLAENRVRNMCLKADPSRSEEQISSLMRKWAADYQLERSTVRDTASSDLLSGENDAEACSSSLDGNDRWVFQWLEVEEDVIAKRVAKIRMGRVGEEVKRLAEVSQEGFLEGIENALRGCETPVARAALVSAIQEKMSRANSSSASISSTTRSILSRFRVGWDTSSGS